MSDTAARSYPTAPPNTVRAQRAFNLSIVVSGIRCTLAYVVFPFAAPLIGLAPGVGPVVGLVVGVIAIASNVWSLRRFWRANHRWKRRMTAVHLSVIALLLVLMALDVRQLLAG